MAQQSAVEWIVLKMLEQDSHRIWPSLLERAKQMEKEQIIDSFCSGAWYENQDIDKYAEEYYNETYK